MSDLDRDVALLALRRPVHGEQTVFCGHSPLVCVTTGLNRCWYSADVINEQTIAFCAPALRIGHLFTSPSQNRKPAMSGLRRRKPVYSVKTNARLYSALISA